MSFVNVLGDHLEIKKIGWNNNNNPTLIFLHPGLGSIELWRDYPDKLSERTGCPALVFCRLGHGRSDPNTWPRPISFLENQGTDVMPTLLKNLDITDSIFVGHSEGATISLVYAGAIGKKIRGVVGIAPHLFTEAAHSVAIGAASRAYEETSLREKLARYHGENVDCCFRGWADTWLQPGFENWSVEHHIPDIRCPVLAIRGQSDNYGTKKQIERLQELANCDLTIEIPPAGHAPHEEMQGEILDLMEKFIKTLL